MENKKISVQEYLQNKELLTVDYIPFDTKLQIVSRIIQGLINSTNGINTSLLRRISKEVFIESISNIDLNIIDENGLKGYDQLCYTGELSVLEKRLGREYNEFETILSEYLSDYIRVETNPAITISAIYNQITQFATVIMDYLSDKIQDLDVEKISSVMSNLTAMNGGAKIEDK